MKNASPFRKGAFFALLAVDLALSLQPHSTVEAMYPPEVQAWDFAVHFAMYAVLSALACAAFVPDGRGPRRGRLAAALALACLGAALELLQATDFVRRSCSTSDAFQNAAGALAGAFAADAGRWLLDRLDGLAGRLKRAAVPVLFPGGETLAAKALRPVRHAAARWLGSWTELFFRPDETVAPDPLRPSARVVASGIAQAFGRCAGSRPSGFRLLVCRAPGSRIGIRLDPARRRCFVDVDPAPPGAPARAEAALPPFAPGAGPTLFSVDGRNLRLVLSASPAGIRIRAPGWSPPLRGGGAVC